MATSMGGNVHSSQMVVHVCLFGRGLRAAAGGWDRQFNVRYDTMTDGMVGACMP
jgi:hypothetical protein